MIRAGFSAIPKTSCSKEMFQWVSSGGRQGILQVDPARVTQPRCPCLALGTGERPFSSALPRTFGTGQVLGPPAASPCLCCLCIPTVWRLAGTQDHLKAFPFSWLQLCPSQKPPSKATFPQFLSTILSHCTSHTDAQAHGQWHGDRVTPALPEQAAAKRPRKAHFRSN